MPGVPLQDVWTAARLPWESFRQMDQSSQPIRRRALDAEYVEEQAEAALVEVEVRGESFRQPTFEALAGPKDEVGKHVLEGVTLRCEPDLVYDANAVRVEVMGQLVGYIERDEAAMFSPVMQRVCGGVLEGRGLIVGGWRDSRSEGSYGIRVWVTQRDVDRLGVRLAVEPEQRVTTPPLPKPGPSERRLSPTLVDLDAGRLGSEVTVAGEEHYQDVVTAALPEGWDEHWCPLLVDLAMAPRNPHSKHDTPCVEVRLGGQAIGYFTPAMTHRYAPLIEAAERDGFKPTARARTHPEVKGGATFWRVKVRMLPTASP
jgi:hypothetical protein